MSHILEIDVATFEGMLRTRAPLEAAEMEVQTFEAFGDCAFDSQKETFMPATAIAPTRPSSSTRLVPPARPTAQGKNPAPVATPPAATKEPEVLYQKYFKSLGHRTYAVQVSRARNNNQFITLIEGRRDRETNEVKKTKLLVFSEDYVEFFRLMHDIAIWVREHPLPKEFQEKRKRYWLKQKSQPNSAGRRHAESDA